MIDQVQARLLRLAALFLSLYALSITLSPIVRLRTWPVDLPWQHWIGLVVWIVMMALLHRQVAISLPERDPILLPAGALLTGWGIMTQFRLESTFGFRQSAWLIVSGILLLLILRRNLTTTILRRYKYLILTGGLILTGLTFLFGTNPLGYGPRLWLGCCGVYLQPSEPLKLFFIIYLSAYIADRQLFIKTMSHRSGIKHIVDLIPVLAPSLLMTSLALTLMLVQRDLGTASIFLLLFTCIVYLTIQDRWVPILSFLTLTISAVSGYFLFDVIRLRIDSWLNPWLDPSGRSYQIVQSLLAVANGGLFGRGPGLGNPGIVPISHSDFIFTSISEEMGLIGGIGMIALIALFAHRGLKAALRTSDLFQRLLAVGLTAYLAGQTILIIGGNLRLLPLTGVTLPFVSYGGSSLVTSYLALLILLMVSSQDEEIVIRSFNNRPYISLHALLLGGLAAASLALGWWSIYRGPDLLTRTDNARRSIADRYVKRGSIFDRNGQPLVITTGDIGSFTREYIYPLLGHTVGYTHPIYGQAGLEASSDPWLRGLEGYPDLQLWWEWIRFGTPPPGLDLRLTLDYRYQAAADELLNGQIGAVVIMDATNGDLLALASYPGFNPNLLDQQWSNLLQDPTAPLVNRVTAGQYPPGSVLTPLLLAKVYDRLIDPVPAMRMEYALETGSLICAQPVPASSINFLNAQAKAGCPGLTASLGEQLGSSTLLEYFHELGFYQVPDIGLHSQASSDPGQILEAGPGAIGIDPTLRLSPLQLVNAAAALSSGGKQPVPRLILALNKPNQGWVSIPIEENPTPLLNSSSAVTVIQSLRVDQTPFWQSIATSSNEGSHEPAFTWWLGGTLPEWPGRPLSIVVLLETYSPDLAIQIGQSLLQVLISSGNVNNP